jgi:alkanesulfonate monooxygenase SsuD/methylene tetrahydromethanopterin reductase-like flavin-dependent oxidoreductase (luciferase family)
MSLPHRSPDPIDMASVRRVAERAKALGFSDLWVTENTLDHVFCLDSVVALTYAAAVTTTIRLGVSVMVLPLHHPVHVAHQIATLDYLRTAGRSSGPVWARKRTTHSFRFLLNTASAASGKAWS